MLLENILYDIHYKFILEELGPGDRANLKKWNEEQKVLWLKLVAKGVVAKRPASDEDIKLFVKFATFFSNYFDKHNKSPNLTKVAQHLNLSI
tara:strand:+ start:3294 stop:3569 length:276 start_codon:yes stop_codon:yes gene_type:complete